MDEKIEVFICYAHEDELLRQELEKQLRVLRRQGLISIWHDRNISPGADWAQEIDTYLNKAHIILLLVSPDFIDSDYCYGIEMQRAMQRHQQGLARVVPIILRPVLWQGTPFAKLQALPTDGKPVLSASWYTQDEAFYNVAEGIRSAIEKLLANPLGDGSLEHDSTGKQKDEEEAHKPSQQQPLAENDHSQENHYPPQPGSSKAEMSVENQNKPNHIICMAALPFEDNQTFPYKTVLLPALRTVLEQDPYYWQVVRADERYFEETIDMNMVAWMKLAQAYIADISDLNPDIMMELGYMRWARKPDQPLIVLQRSGTESRHLTNLAGVIRIQYPAASGNYAVQEIVKALEAEFAKSGRLRHLNRQKEAHYLSPLLLSEKFRVDDRTATILAEAYVTMENFVLADGDDIRRKAPKLSRGVATGLRADIADLLKELKANKT